MRILINYKKIIEIYKRFPKNQRKWLELFEKTFLKNFEDSTNVFWMKK